MQTKQQKNQPITQQNILKLNRKSTFNLQGQFSNQLFKRIFLRLKVHKVIKHWKKLYKNSFNRYKRIQEWMNTEKAYIDDLKIIVFQIEKPLRQKNLITEDQEKIIFPNMNSMIVLSEQMYSTMKQILSKWHPFKTQIAPAVIKLSSFFKIYIEYFNNYLHGKQILDLIKDKPQVKAIQKSLKMDFDSYLSKPTQRPVKYKLLLTDYQKKLRNDHPDYTALTKAIKIYHQVVQKTNQALQNQRRMHRMIQMQKTFKNILQSSRQWKFQFDAYFQDLQTICKIYVFSDLLLIATRKHNKEQLVCKMLIDGNCFVESCEQLIDQKISRIFIAGRQNVGYFLFQNVDQRNRIFIQLSKLINSLHINDWKRKEIISHNIESKRYSSSMRFSKPFFQEDYYEMFDSYNRLKKKFKVTVVGVERRSLNKCKNSYYVIKLQLPFPQVINQKAFVKFQDMQDLQYLLKLNLNKWALVKEQNATKISWKSISQIPKEYSKGNNIQLDSRTVQYRATRLQTFINFILRNKQTLKNSNLIFYKLKMFQCLYQYLTDNKNQCIECEICCQKGDIISNLQSYQAQLKSRLKTKQQRGEQNLCTYRSFHVQNRLASHNIDIVKKYTVEQTLLYINSKLGIINQSLTNRIAQGQCFSLMIYRPCYLDLANQKNQTRQNFYTLKVYKRDTVGNVLEMLRSQLNLQGVKQFGLVLTYKDQTYLLHQDEYIYDVVRQNNITFQTQQQVAQKPVQQISTRSSFKSFFSKIKTDIDSKIDQIRQKLPPARLQFRKIYMFSSDVQSYSCKSDSTRRQILSDEIFYQFKNRQLNMHHNNIVRLSSLFICIQHNARLRMLKRSDITKTLLQPLFPTTRSHIVNSQFLDQIYKIIQIYQSKNSIKKEDFQIQLIQLVNDNLVWNTQLFLAENLKIQSFFGINQKYFRIGVNWQYFVVFLQGKTQNCLVKISLDKVRIRFSGFLIQVSDGQERDYRFICDNVFMFRMMLQKYEAFNKFFLARNKQQGRPMIEETF